MPVKKRNAFIIAAIIILVALTAFLLYWFLGRTIETNNEYKLVAFDVKKPKSTSLNGDKLPNGELNECGQPFQFHHNTFEDFVAPGGTFGWTAYFEYKTADGDDNLICGGSIINERYILTAAHCVYGRENRKLKIEAIRLGLSNAIRTNNCDEAGFCGTPISVGIEEIIPYPDYDVNFEKFRNDIALIRVDENIKFSKFMNPICLTDRDDLFKGKKYLVGWSRNMTGNENEQGKYVVALTSSNSTKCEAYFTKNFLKTKIDTTSTICAAGDETKEYCIHNSGHALAAYSDNRWYAEGIDSFGKTCGEKGSMGLYTAVSHFYKWIKSVIKK